MDSINIMDAGRFAGIFAGAGNQRFYNYMYM